MKRIASITIALAGMLAALPAPAGSLPWQVLGSADSAASPSGQRQLSPEERQRLRQQVRDSERERQQSKGRR